MNEAAQIAQAAQLPQALVTWREELDSTNRQLSQWAQEGVPHAALLAAGRQSAARGCGEKKFFSPVGGAYFSLLLRTGLPPEGELPVTPRAALAVRRVLLRYGVAVGIKWVNDLFLRGKKVCGILAQALQTPQGSAVVVGVGLNLRQSEALPRELEPIVGYCAAHSDLLPQPPVIIGEIAAELLSLCAVQGQPSNAALLEEYRRASIVLGRRVTYLENGCSRVGVAADILPQGALLLRLPDGGRKELTSGHIALL
ncbi:MAG: biotin--[acetyl-CoA-carboxylase] ligase [Oscillospiraceae bacterium]|jgi:BirA family biotin operon repressor/biotin-[acetyl-CoA-carboxylase] ligase|nr:biotin--[acetyl-CoA-carboxylase] ligase [Oscillospiraceae bacterium]